MLSMAFRILNQRDALDSVTAGIPANALPTHNLLKAILTRCRKTGP